MNFRATMGFVSVPFVSIRNNRTNLRAFPATRAICRAQSSGGDDHVINSESINSVHGVNYQSRQAHQPAVRLSATVTAVAAAAALVVASSGGVESAGGYGLERGRLEKCRGDVPCISTTSVGNPSKFGPPWSYQPQTGDADAAWASLKAAVAAHEDGGKIVESVDGPKEYYLRAEFPSKWLTWSGTDDMEFRLVKQDSLVTYRSASREAIFIYPLQTPINTNKNKIRLEDIRSKLGWTEFAGEELYTADAPTGTPGATVTTTSE